MCRRWLRLRCCGKLGFCGAGARFDVDGKRDGRPCFVGYVLYGIGVLCVGTVILMLFIAAGWLDMEMLNQNLQALMSARK